MHAGRENVDYDQCESQSALAQCHRLSGIGCLEDNVTALPSTIRETERSSDSWSISSTVAGNRVLAGFWRGSLAAGDLRQIDQESERSLLSP